MMRTPRPLLRLAAAAATTLTLAACATTTFQSTWKAPDVRPLRLTGRKVVAVFLNKDPVLRRRAEDAMAREITARGANGVPSYTILTDQEVQDRAVAKAKVERLGFSGAVVMRLVGSETQYTVEPAGPVWVGPHYHQFWEGYWGWGWGTVWDPAYLSVDKIVKVETLIYSLEQDRLVWAGVSETLNPSEIESFISELAAAVTKRMVKDGLLTPA